MRTPSKVVPINQASEVGTTSVQLNVHAVTGAGHHFPQEPAVTLTPGGSSSGDENPPSQEVRSYAAASSADRAPRITLTDDIEIIESAQTELVEVEELSDSLAEEIVNQVVERLSGKFLDQLSDQIVTKLYEKLTKSHR